MVASPHVGHGSTDLRQLGHAGRAGKGGVMLVNGGLWQCGTFWPDVGEQVHIGAHGGTHLGQGVPQLLRGSQAQHRAIYADDLAVACVLRQPLHMVGGCASVDLDQLDARVGQFGFGLCPVAAVGKQRSAVLRNDQGAHGPGEARQPFAALPAGGQVLGQMRIAGGNQASRQAQLGQGALCVGYALGKNIGRGSHRGSLWEGCRRQGGAQTRDCRTAVLQTRHAGHITDQFAVYIQGTFWCTGFCIELVNRFTR